MSSSKINMAEKVASRLRKEHGIEMVGRNPKPEHLHYHQQVHGHFTDAREMILGMIKEKEVGTANEVQA